MVGDGSPLTEKIEDHDVRAPILGMSRVMAIACRIPVLAIATTNRHDPPRTVLLDPLLDQVNCAGKSVDACCGSGVEAWSSADSRFKASRNTVAA